MSGRAQVKAPQTDVRIALQPRGGANQGHASIRPARPRIEPISNIDPRTKSLRTRAMEARAAASTPRIWSRRQPKRRPFSLRIARERGEDLLTYRQSTARSGWNARQAGSKTGPPRNPIRSSRGRRGEDKQYKSRFFGPFGWSRTMTGRTHCRRRSNRERPVDAARPRALVEENLIRTAQSEPDRSSSSGQQAVAARSKRSDPKNGDVEQQRYQAPQPIPAEILAGATSVPDIRRKASGGRPGASLATIKPTCRSTNLFDPPKLMRREPTTGSSRSRAPIDRPGQACPGCWAAHSRSSTRPSSRARAASIPPSAGSSISSFPT